MRDPHKAFGAFLFTWLIASILGVVIYCRRERMSQIRQEKMIQAAIKRKESLKSFERTRWKVDGLDGDYEFGKATTIAYVHSLDARPKTQADFGEKHPWESASRLMIDDIIRIRVKKSLPIEAFAPESMGGLPKEELLTGEWIQSPRKERPDRKYEGVMISMDSDGDATVSSANSPSRPRKLKEISEQQLKALGIYVQQRNSPKAPNIYRDIPNNQEPKAVGGGG